MRLILNGRKISLDRATDLEGSLFYATHGIKNVVYPIEWTRVTDDFLRAKMRHGDLWKKPEEKKEIKSILQRDLFGN